MASGLDMNTPGFWAAALALMGGLFKAVQITRRLDRMDDKMDKMSDDIAFMRGLMKGK